MWNDILREAIERERLDGVDAYGKVIDERIEMEMKERELHESMYKDISDHARIEIEKREKESHESMYGDISDRTRIEMEMRERRIHESLYGDMPDHSSPATSAINIESVFSKFGPKKFGLFKPVLLEPDQLESVQSSSDKTELASKSTLPVSTKSEPDKTETKLELVVSILNDQIKLMKTQVNLLTTIN